MTAECSKQPCPGSFIASFLQDNREIYSFTVVLHVRKLCVLLRFLLQFIFENISCNEFIIFNTQEENKA